ncbi:MAG: hypothetical protein K2N05_12345 [Muribaculaceae bacterium]|nr:hypothetical protein [Muribaculaceae bacterium]
MENSNLTALVRMSLAELGYPDTAQTDATVGRLCSLREESHKLLMEWLRNEVPVTFSPIQGIDSTFLREILGMKEPAIIIAHQMLLDEPVENAKYFRQLAITKR